MKFLAILFSVVIFSSCNNNSTDKEAKATIIHKDSALPEKAVPNVSIVNDTLIRMQFTVADTGVIASANANINGDDHIICEVIISKADSIYAEVSPEEQGGNVRLSQIIMPDGTADGPFGRELHYATPQTGTYKLRIGENMMAGDKWKGRFKIKVWVK